MKHKLDRAITFSGRFVIATFVLYVASPLVIIFKAYLTDSLRPELFVAPLRDLYYFFDATTSPVFEICYAVNVAKIGIVTVVYLATTFMFVELMVYLLGLYWELNMMVGGLSTSSTSEERLIKWRQCIRFHMEIIGYVARVM